MPSAWPSRQPKNTDLTKNRLGYCRKQIRFCYRKKAKGETAVIITTEEKIFLQGIMTGIITAETATQGTMTATGKTSAMTDTDVATDPAATTVKRDVAVIENLI